MLLQTLLDYSHIALSLVLFIQLSDELLYLCRECCYLLCQLCILRRLRFNDL